jgi:3-deoxy-D-manno-octulosonic-acid transferase
VLNRPCVRYSALAEGKSDGITTTRTLLIDNVGMLNTLYRYGTVAYIGGGFGRGIHNTLEPAAFGLPVIMGPRHQKFVEARALVAKGGAFVVHSATDLQQILRHLADATAYQRASAAARDYVAANRGATKKVVDYLSHEQRVTSHEP